MIYVVIITTYFILLLAIALWDDMDIYVDSVKKWWRDR